MPNRVSPLNTAVRIVSEEGTPTPEFLRWIQAQLAVNEGIVSLDSVEEVSDVIDVLQDPAPAIHGSILFRGTSYWKTLAAGVSGRVLRTLGAGLDPVWAALSFLDLSDTPSSYSGSAGRKIKVNSGETALEMVSDTILSLTDTPSNFTGQSGKVVSVNVAETAVEFTTPAAGVTTWLGLSDTDPAGFTGEAGNAVVVNADEDGLEFGAAPGGGGGGAATPAEFGTYSLSTGDTISKSTDNQIQFDTEDKAASFGTLATATGVVTIDTAGTYTVQWAVHLTNGSAGDTTMRVGVKVNGTKVVPETTHYHSFSWAQTINGSVTIDVAAADTVELYMNYTGGASGSDTVSTLGKWTWMQITQNLSGGGSAGGGYTLIDTFDLSVDDMGSGNEPEVTGLDSYSEIHWQIVGGICASNTIPAVQLSEDGGTTWLSSSGDYNESFIGNHGFTGVNTATRTWAIIGGEGSNWNGIGTMKYHDTTDSVAQIDTRGAGNSAMYHILTFKGDTAVADAMRFVLHQGSAFTAGTLNVWGVS